MLEHVPHWLGERMRSLRAGADKVIIAQPNLELADSRMDLVSPTFADGAPMPPRFTADGEGTSPPLVWSDPPDGAAALALIVEDPDAPSPEPLVHGLVAGLSPLERSLQEGELVPGIDKANVGRNSYLMRGWLPPDPPNGHGPHNYVFELFALSEMPDLGDAPGRSELTEAMAGRVLAEGVLVGTYERG